MTDRGSRRNGPVIMCFVTVAVLSATQFGQARAAGAKQVPCAAWSYAVGTNGGNVAILNSQSVVDSYSSTAGPYGGTNIGSNALIQSATSIVNNGALIRGTQRQNAPVDWGSSPSRPAQSICPLGSSVRAQSTSTPARRA